MLYGPYTEVVYMRSFTECDVVLIQRTGGLYEKFYRMCFLAYQTISPLFSYIMKKVIYHGGVVDKKGSTTARRFFTCFCSQCAQVNDVIK